MSKLDESRTETTRDDYETPGHVLDRVREVFDGPIDLDPCTKASNPTRARVFLTEGGLCDWLPTSIRTAFVNPPYGDQLKPWVEHCVAQAARGFDVITLTPARPDTRWYDTLACNARVVAAIRGRITFCLDGKPVLVLDKKSGKMKPSPCQFPCALALLTQDDGMVERFCRVMARDNFARLETVIRAA